MTDSINTILENLPIENNCVLLKREQFIEICKNVGMNSDNAQLLEISEHAFLLTIKHANTIGHELHIKSKAWTVKLSAGVLKSSIMGAILTGIFFASGYTMIPGFVLPAIIPLLFDVEKIHISEKDNLILAKIAINKGMLDDYKNPEIIYQSLPSAITDELSKYDFIDFVEKMVLAGAFDKNDGHEIFIPSSSKMKFRVTFI